MRQDQGHLIVLDAIDGAGKSTAMNAVVEHLKRQGKKIFNLVEWTKQHHTFPEVTEPELAEADVLISAEPTYTWVGAAVREELMRQHDNRVNDGFITSEGYSLDRYILFKRIILPFLQGKPDRWVIQDRGVITTLVYQPIQDARVTLEWLTSLSGNKLELANPPDKIVLLRIMPEQAMERLAKRTDKQDNDIYSSPSFQERVAAGYRDENILSLFRNVGTTVVEVDASKTPDEVGKSVIQAIFP